MEKIQTKTLSFSSMWNKVFIFGILFLIALIVPLFIHSQWITGPLINALLILTCVLVGPMEAMLLGIIPSTAAMTSGLLPLPLAPMVPFIILSNAIFIAGFHYMGKSKKWMGVIGGAALKYAFLFLTVQFLAGKVLQSELMAKVAVIMSWPQFATALIGGFIALGIIKVLKK